MTLIYETREVKRLSLETRENARKLAFALFHLRIARERLSALKPTYLEVYRHIGAAGMISYEWRKCMLEMLWKKLDFSEYCEMGMEPTIIPPLGHEEWLAMTHSFIKALLPEQVKWKNFDKAGRRLLESAGYVC